MKLPRLTPNDYAFGFGVMAGGAVGIILTVGLMALFL